MRLAGRYRGFLALPASRRSAGEASGKQAPQTAADALGRRGASCSSVLVEAPTSLRPGWRVLPNFRRGQPERRTYDADAIRTDDDQRSAKMPRRLQRQDEGRS